MTLQPFAKPGDLQAVMPAVADALALLAVETASAEIRASLKWDVDAVTGRTWTVNTDPLRRGAWWGGLYYHTSSNTDLIYKIIIPYRNVTAVTSVVVDGVTLTGQGVDYDLHLGVVTLYFPATSTATVTYNAGYSRAPVDNAPAVLRTVCLERAIRFISNPAGEKAIYLGDARQQFNDTPTIDDDHRLDALRLSA